MTSSEPDRTRADYNAEFVADWSDSRWASWYLAAVDDRNRRTFEPLRLHPDARIANEVEDLYIVLHERSRFQMRVGIGLALRCWNQAHHSYVMLRGLCWIAAQIRANEAVPVLLQIIKDYRTVLFTGSDEMLTVADDLVSILAGFVPDRDGRIEELFEDLLFDDSVEPTLAATLGVAISASDPSSFARCFNRYYVLRNRVPSGYFSDEDVLAAFAEAVPRVAIAKSVSSLTTLAHIHWMRVGIRAKRYSSDEYIVPLASIVSIDLEGRTDVPDYTWPMHGEEDVSRELIIRYELALNELKRSERDARNDGASIDAERSALDSVYALAE